MAETIKSRLQALYRAQDSLPKLLDDVSIPNQSMEDYCVKLQMLIEHKGDRQDIDVRDIFSNIEHYDAPRKVLVLGIAGVGETTFLHYLTYAWACKGLFANQFQVVFKVKLKKLLSDEFRAQLSKLSDNTMMKFAKLLELVIQDQYVAVKNRYQFLASIGQLEAALAKNGLTEEDLQRSSISKEEILSILSDPKINVLLLLDGFDEIAHLDGMDPLVGEIMNEM